MAWAVLGSSRLRLTACWSRRALKRADTKSQNLPRGATSPKPDLLPPNSVSTYSLAPPDIAREPMDASKATNSSPALTSMLPWEGSLKWEAPWLSEETRIPDHLLGEPGEDGDSWELQYAAAVSSSFVPAPLSDEHQQMAKEWETPKPWDWVLPNEEREEINKARGARAERLAETEGLTLLKSDDNVAGYRCVSDNRAYSRDRGFGAKVSRRGKSVHLGSFATAEEAALCYARSPEGKAAAAAAAAATAAPPPMTAQEAVQIAKAEGLTLLKADNTSGYKNVCFDSRSKSKPYQAQVHRDGKSVSLGYFAMAEEAALVYARTPEAQAAASAAAAAPPPMTAQEAVRIAKAEGLTLLKADNTSGYKNVSFDSRSQAKPYVVKVRRDGNGKQVRLGSFATAQEAALCYARSPEGRPAAASAAAAPPPMTAQEAASSRKRKAAPEEEPEDADEPMSEEEPMPMRPAPSPLPPPMTATPLPPSPQSSVQPGTRVSYPEPGCVMEIDDANIWVKFEGFRKAGHPKGWYSYARNDLRELLFETGGRGVRAKRSRSDA